MARWLFMVGALALVVSCKDKYREAPPPRRTEVPPPPHATEPVPVAKAADAPTTLVEGDAHATSLAIDSKGNVVLAVEIKGKVHVGKQSFDGGEGGCLLISTPVAGPPRWAKLLAKERNVEYATVAIDHHDAIILAATLRGDVDLGGGVLHSAGNQDILVAKLGADGSHVWSHRFGGSEPDRPTNVALDSKDRVVVGGYFAGTVDFGGKKLTGKNDAEMFVARYSASGTLEVANRLSGGGTETSELYDVAVDSKDTMIAIGAFGDKLDLGGKSLAGVKDKAVNSFIVGYAPSGGVAWTKAYAPGSTTMAQRVVADNDGSLILTGAELGMPIDDNKMVGFDPATGKGIGGAMTSFVARVGANHEPVWILPISELAMGDEVNAVVADNGDVLLVGDAASAPFHDSKLEKVHTYFARLSAAGKLIEARELPNATPITADPAIATRGGTTVVVVTTGESSPDLVLMRP